MLGILRIVQSGLSYGTVSKKKKFQVSFKTADIDEFFFSSSPIADVFSYEFYTDHFHRLRIFPKVQVRRPGLIDDTRPRLTFPLRVFISRFAIEHSNVEIKKKILFFIFRYSARWKKGNRRIGFTSGGKKKKRKLELPCTIISRVLLSVCAYSACLRTREHVNNTRYVLY